MHYERSYEGTQEEKDAAAIKDVKDYLGDHIAAAIVFVEHSKTHDECAMGLSFAGIQGYPVHAMIRAYGSDELKASLLNANE